jgi:hypothetical protein
MLVVQVSSLWKQRTCTNTAEELYSNMMPRTKTTIMGQNFHIYNVRTTHHQSRKKITIHRHHHHVYASHASSNQKLKKLYSCTFVLIPVYAHLYSTKIHFAYFSTGGPAIMSICIYSNLPKRTIYLSGSCTSIQPESPVAANSIWNMNKPSHGSERIVYIRGASQNW